MKHLNKYLGLIFLISILACNQNPDFENIKMAEEEIVATIAADEIVETVERKLIKEGQVEFETKNLNSSRKVIFDAVLKFNAYVSSDQEFKSPGRNSNSLILRIPADKFDDLFKEATQGVEKFERKEIKVIDVTEEFLDIKARLKTKKELENRFLELLGKAKNVTEILEIEKQIGQLRTEIESIEGRLKYLENKVSFSTLTMTFYETIPNQTEFGQKFKNGFMNGWNNLIWFFVAMTNIWPFILIGLGLIFGIKIYRRKK